MVKKLYFFCGSLLLFNSNIYILACPSEKEEPPLFLERFQEKNVLQGETVRLLAKVSGNPVPKITWLKNNKPLQPSERVQLSYDGENIELIILDADTNKDTGDYKCIATNPIGKASHGSKIIVDLEKITFTKNLKKTVTIQESETLILECETSHPVSTNWSHNNNNVSGMDHREVIHDGKLHKLIIKKSTVKDHGFYRCTVRDQVTESSVTIKAIIPEFIRKLQDFEVKERETAVLEVEITSETADVSWHKDGEELTKANPKYVFEKQGTVRKLLIRDASVHDEGEYTCTVADKECTAEVTVVELPPEIITKMKDVTIAKGEKAMFEIELTKGDALVRWFKNKVELKFSDHVQLSIDGKRQRLKIYNAVMEDAGIYECQVGEQNSKAKLTVEEPIVEFITKLPDVTLVSKNTDAFFTVKISKSDIPVKWFIKGKEIQPNDKFIITSDDTGVKTLTIKKCTEEDQSEVTCVALNVKTSSKLKVEGNSIISSLSSQCLRMYTNFIIIIIVTETAPKIHIDDTKKEYKVRENEDINMTLEYTSTTLPRDEWSCQGIVLVKSKRINTKITDSSASLTIKKVQETDAGQYTLDLRNNAGRTSAVVSLTVISKFISYIFYLA